MTEQEFRQLVIPLQKLMFGIALKMGLRPNDAADAVQETQIKLWRHRDGIPEDPGDLRLYSMAAVRRQCISMLRSRKISVSIEEVSEMPAPEEDGSAEYRDQRQRIKNLIDSLPPGQRDALRLSAFGGLDNSEIAEVTGMSESTVRQLLSRGRKRLRELFNK